jgi:hypothetical protein
MREMRKWREMGEKIINFYILSTVKQQKYRTQTDSGKTGKI